MISFFLVCPVHEPSADALLKYVYDVQCKIVENTCQLEEEIIRDNYLNYAVVLYQNNLGKYGDISKSLSDCGIRPITIDTSHTAVNFSSVCTNSKTTIVIDTTTESLHVAQVRSISCCFPTLVT